VDISGFPNVAAHFKRIQERPSVKKLLAYEKEVNEGLPRPPRRVAQNTRLLRSESLRRRLAPKSGEHLHRIQNRKDLSDETKNKLLYENAKALC
jgi:hypothetical protein